MKVNAKRFGLGRLGGRRYNVCVRATPLPLDIKKVTPVGGRTFLKVEEIEEQTDGGIFLPDAAQQKQTVGTVMFAEDGVGFSVGNKVVYSQFAGTEVEVEGAEHVILKNDDVVGVMPGADAKDMKPTGNGILLEIEKEDEKTSSGIFLTGSTKEKPSTGKVLAMGPGRKNDEGKVEPIEGLSVGDSVLYNKFSGVDFEAKDGTALIVIKDHDILATLD
ncbi:chaperonin 10 [Chloropicon primus]|uniref:20 kDa chaperonin, chloroplastic n=1 Tax=Chloropicon primus TaxID=1764295 RepID=A0A5B8MWR6_9CHLO|nr:chaperonin 10 [Chloropicon primus]UPR03324.1 chaperonin 10 [Chloropicon primus]|eukprot:QDZ24115.1 chaperonin 10 [Chloropicon primus]